jgi:hypothetical protein
MYNSLGHGLKLLKIVIPSHQLRCDIVDHLKKSTKLKGHALITSTIHNQIIHDEKMAEEKETRRRNDCLTNNKVFKPTRKKFGLDEYLKLAKKNGTYGTDNELYAFVDLHKRPVDVYVQEEDGSYTLIQSIRPVRDRGLDPIMMLFRYHGHYDALQFREATATRITTETTTTASMNRSMALKRAEVRLSMMTTRKIPRDGDGSEAEDVLSTETGSGAHTKPSSSDAREELHAHDIASHPVNKRDKTPAKTSEGEDVRSRKRVASVSVNTLRETTSNIDRRSQNEVETDERPQSEEPWTVVTHARRGRTKIHRGAEERTCGKEIEITTNSNERRREQRARNGKTDLSRIGGQNKVSELGCEISVTIFLFVFSFSL